MSSALGLFYNPIIKLIPRLWPWQPAIRAARRNTRYSVVVLQHGQFSWKYLQWTPGPRFNTKMTSFRYKKSHCGDKTVIKSSYLHNRISYTSKMTSLYWIRALWFIHDILSVFCQFKVYFFVLPWSLHSRHNTLNYIILSLNHTCFPYIMTCWLCLEFKSSWANECEYGLLLNFGTS